MKRYLKWSIIHEPFANSILIGLTEVTEAAGRKAMVRTLDTGRIFYLTFNLPKISAKIAKKQTKMLDYWKSNRKNIELTDRLCTEFEAGEYVLEDAQTTEVIGKVVAVAETKKFKLKLLPDFVEKD